ncbi:MAG: 2-amino-4-hydroxy-6-hydroxymethyldihydropteridine diphosphokinase [Phycisphaerae bacterium]|jgi:2-amino-4-hydroxy-6-hydroxymethyldihydropteridine diphosphokinase|nr:2-amino-4-hydroxy-6-hydroxymethyldihydropteridine diphosphokinase [Phycisphaerae bacterium]HOO16572.1 2-amino-4-hydroxy-6-hydroxymethyldihydropteridine diphosphokinase [Phycisphaerae bacterium]HPC21718.1 2-amino-4-hydroxy-6-hydroxymethyldihydropteridine diphosphokinase [Phycisphaerae bacterium]HRS27990.1 2-amino-4-hydroxy-6-hydroxymethyldihydropteridine diphosphokinase [Phycisphaerae bacterium]HRT41951.1 2-amino-4-hydroxy-6-hydroxymethyldihydropteridine diphosphokinase [Phycisphaerae bacteri
MPEGGIYIAMGSNLGDRERHIRTALAELEEQGDIRVLRCSSLRETDPVGGPPGQPRYLNGAAELDTQLPPHALLQRMLAIEARHGRVRNVKNGARTLDLDLLIYRDQRVTEADLTIPHPRMWEREFVMAPLAEIQSPDQLSKMHQSAASPRPQQ